MSIVRRWRSGLWIMLRLFSLAAVYFRVALLSGMASLVASKSLAADLDVKVQDRNGQSLSRVVVLIESASEEPAKPAAPTAAVVDQLHQQFVPGVIAVRTGTAISFPNSDTVSHQVYSFSPAKRFELGLYRGVPRDPVVFDKPGIVVLGCNIHDNMIGYVYVTDALYFGTTDVDGRFRARVSSGRYRVHVWSPRFSKSDDAAEHAIQIGGESSASLPIQITGSVRAPGLEQDARRLRDY
jgi:plastocyanin